MIWDMFVASQASLKGAKDYVDKLKPPVELGPEDLLKDFGA